MKVCGLLILLIGCLGDYQKMIYDNFGKQNNKKDVIIETKARDKANVIVKTEGLLENEVAQIAEIVYSEAGISPSNITLVEKA